MMADGFMLYSTILVLCAILFMISRELENGKLSMKLSIDEFVNCKNLRLFCTFGNLTQQSLPTFFQSTSLAQDPSGFLLQLSARGVLIIWSVMSKDEGLQSFIAIMHRL
jgi:hypothetical protein